MVFKNVISKVRSTIKKAVALKKHLTLNRVVIGVAIIAVLAMIFVSIIYPHHIKKSHNEATQILLRHLSLAAIATETWGTTLKEVAFTDGVSETAEAAVVRLTEFGFRPDPSIAFHVMPVGDYDFIAFAAHNSVGSTAYVYDDRDRVIREARESDHYEVYGNITFARPMPDLFCYTYDPSNAAAPVVKKANSTKIAPDSKDKAPARLVVVVAAE